MLQRVVKLLPYCGGRWTDRWDTLLLALAWWTPCRGTLGQPAPHLPVSTVHFPPVGVTMLTHSDPSWEDRTPLITADKCAVKDNSERIVGPQRRQTRNDNQLTISKELFWHQGQNTVYIVIKRLPTVVTVMLLDFKILSVFRSCHVTAKGRGAVLSTVVSLQEGCRLKSPWGQGLFCVELKYSSGAHVSFFSWYSGFVSQSSQGWAVI